MLLRDHLRRACDKGPERVAIVAGEQRWTFAQFDELSDRIAAALSRRGIEVGDRVALQLGNCPEIILAYYACFKLGAIAVPINNRFATAELAYTLHHSESRVCISQVDLIANIDPIRGSIPNVEHYILIDSLRELTDTIQFSDLIAEPVGEYQNPPLDSEAVAAILYTSGTTSRPKGVTHTNHSLTATAIYHSQCIELDSDDVVCIIPPLCHILGFATQLIASVWAGATVVVLPQTDPQTILETIHRLQATRIAALPVLLQTLINFPASEPYGLDSLRTICAGGDAVPVALQEKFYNHFGLPLLEGCGMTEVIPFTLNLPSQRRTGSIGRACPGMSIRIVDELGADMGIDCVGEILVRSDAAMIGYWREPELTAATIVDGYIHTGDLGRLDADGFYWFMGRKKEIIIRAGSNISPLEVEEVLYQHPAVRECGVVGVPHPDWGEVVWAYVALAPDQSASAEELKQFCRNQIASYKVPEHIVFLAELPKGSTGKVHRRSLRDQAIQTSPTN